MRQLNVHKLVRNLNKLCDYLYNKYDINYEAAMLRMKQPNILTDFT